MTVDGNFRRTSEETKLGINSVFIDRLCIFQIYCMRRSYHPKYWAGSDTLIIFSTHRGLWAESCKENPTCLPCIKSLGKLTGRHPAFLAFVVIASLGIELNLITAWRSVSSCLTVKLPWWETKTGCVIVWFAIVGSCSNQQVINRLLYFEPRQTPLGFQLPTSSHPHMIAEGVMASSDWFHYT